MQFKTTEKPNYINVDDLMHLLTFIIEMNITYWQLNDNYCHLSIDIDRIDRDRIAPITTATASTTTNLENSNTATIK